MMMETEHTNIPPKHVNAKGSVGGRKRSGSHVMMKQTQHTNIPAKHDNAKCLVGGRKRSRLSGMMMQTNIPPKHVNATGSRSGIKIIDNGRKKTYHLNMSMPRVRLEEETKVDIMYRFANRTYTHTF